jgi:uncharacterized membrane protein YjdF
MDRGGDAHRFAAFVPTAVAASLIVLAIAFVARVPTYRVAPAFLIPMLWGVLRLRRRVHLHPLHYVLLAAAVVLHDLGAFGFYQRSFGGLSFDIYVHFYFAFAGALIVERFVAHTVPSLGTWPVRLTTLLFMMGLGAIHELGEYVSYVLLGEERGMLKPSTSYFFDTQRDLLNNLLGTLTALACTTVVRLARRKPAGAGGASR